MEKNKGGYYHYSIIGSDDTDYCIMFEIENIKLEYGIISTAYFEVKFQSREEVYKYRNEFIQKINLYNEFPAGTEYENIYCDIGENSDNEIEGQ